MAVLPGITVERATRIAEAIRASVASAFAEAPTKVTTSIGVATFTQVVEATQATAFADKLMYISKKDRGRNAVTADMFAGS